MAERSEALAAKFEAANNDVIATIEAASDEQWKTVCADEGWSVGVVAHHIGGGHPLIAGLVQGLASGADIPPLTSEQLDQANAQHANDHANCTKEETLEMLRTGGSTAASAVRGLTDEQLDRSSTVIAGAPDMTVEQVIENVMIGSVTGHHASIKKAI
ncbi:MAG: DinB family protein [Chloroflexi bacterium]|nr:DinB family protein [Chloroflexota bacterium]